MILLYFILVIIIYETTRERFVKTYKTENKLL